MRIEQQISPALFDTRSANDQDQQKHAKRTQKAKKEQEKKEKERAFAV